MVYGSGLHVESADAGIVYRHARSYARNELRYTFTREIAQYSTTN